MKRWLHHSPLWETRETVCVCVTTDTFVRFMFTLHLLIFIYWTVFFHFYLSTSFTAASEQTSAQTPDRFSSCSVFPRTPSSPDGISCLCLREEPDLKNQPPFSSQHWFWLICILGCELGLCLRKPGTAVNTLILAVTIGGFCFLPSLFQMSRKDEPSQNHSWSFSLLL